MAKPTQSALSIPTVFTTSEKGLDGPWRLIEVTKESYTKKDGDNEIPGSLVTLVLQRCSMPKDEDIVGVLNGEEQKPGNPPRFTKGVGLPTLKFSSFRYDASATIPKPFWYMKLIKPYECEVPGSEMVRFWDACGWNRKLGKDFAVLKTCNGELPKVNGAIDHNQKAGPNDALVYLNLKFVPNGPKYRAKNVIVGFSVVPPDEDFADAELETADPSVDQESEEIDPTQPEAEEKPEQAQTTQAATTEKETTEKATTGAPENTAETTTGTATVEVKADDAKPGKKKPQ
jgi:hypothetical protein